MGKRLRIPGREKITERHASYGCVTGVSHFGVQPTTSFLDIPDAPGCYKSLSLSSSRRPPFSLPIGFHVALTSVNILL